MEPKFQSNQTRTVLRFGFVGVPLKPTGCCLLTLTLTFLSLFSFREDLDIV